MEQRALAVIVGAFAFGALLLVAAGRDPSRRNAIGEIWKLWWYELAIVGFVLVPAWLGPIPFALAVGLMAVRSQWELHQAMAGGGEAGERGGVLVLGLATLGAAAVLGPGPIWHGAVGAVALVLVGDLARPIPDVARRPGRSGRIGIPLVYPPMFLAYLVWLRGRPDGFALVAFLYCVLEATDSFALVVGKLFGRTKVFPRLTPGKTWAGLLGGLALGGATGIAFGLFATPLPPARVIGATLFLLVATVLGDLVASRLKRELGIKDFAPGTTPHGGVLDIYDSLVFAAPVAYWILG